jgi:protein translocase SEC61 complex gamma subunit
MNLECAVNMGIRSFLSQCARTLKLAVKPGRTELWLSIKISLLGIGVVGLVGFVIKILSFAVGGASSPSSTTG